MKSILFIFFLLLLPFFGSSQNYADKKYYLVDSLDLDALTKRDRQLLDSCLKLFHVSKQDTSKISALNGICENMVHEDWSKYQFFQYRLIENALTSDQPIRVRKILLTYLASAFSNIGTIYNYQGDIPKAINYFHKSLKIQKEIGHKKGIATSLNNIGFIYQNKGDIPMAINYFLKSIKIQEEIGDKKGLAYSFSNIGAIYDMQGDIPNALRYLNRSLKIREEIGDKIGLATSLNNIAAIYEIKGNIPKALQLQYKSLKVSEEIGDKKGIATSLNNIGITYKNRGDFSVGLKYFHKSLKICKEIGDKKGIATSLNSIGYAYSSLGKFSIALEYFYKSLKIREEIGDKKGFAETLNNIGGIYQIQSEPFKALECFHKSLDIREEIGDKKGMTNSLYNIGVIEFKQNELKKAEEYGNNSLAIAKEIGYAEYIQRASLFLSNLYEKQGKGMEALEMYKLSITMRDSINNEATQKATAQQQAKYEYEKQKVLDDAEHDKQIAIEQEAKEKQQILTYATGGGLGLVGIFLIFVFNRLQVTRKQKAVIETQKQEVEKQKTVVELAHHELEEKNQEILDSITYAKRIQNAILPPLKVVKKYLQESFILYKPKDIVAGDFYWLEHKDNKVLFAAADCTGHGVPGAMVSVVCNNGLNRSVREYGLTDPGEILNKTREIVIAEFEKSEDEVKDGMDIALCSLKLPSREGLGGVLKYAGANNPLWIIRPTRHSALDAESVEIEGQAHNDDFELIEIKADKQPIGKFDELLPYTTHTFELQKGDSIYIFSDGYVDQFGGEKGKKFKAAAFRALLLSIQDKKMEDQRSLIDEAFEVWKGSLEQIDDVCVIGVRI
ncbi:MAG: tetratricopeptide repeat protein [Flavobacteriales bacterium]